MKLQIGDKVPDFTTTAVLSDGKTENWVLSEQVKKNPVLFVFYPGDFTAVCTKQLCDYRDNWEMLKAFKLQIVGISANDHDSHVQFSSTLKLPFPLLDDSNKEIAKALDMQMLSGLLGGLTSRGFVLVDQNQTFKYQFKELVPMLKRSAAEVAEMLRENGVLR